MKLPSFLQSAQARGVRAFSIIEALVATGVVGVMFVALYTGISAGFGVLQLARENLRATQVMIDKMESLRLYNWTQVSTFGTSTSYIPSTFTESFYPATTNYSLSSVSTGSAGGGFVYYGTVTITNAGFTQNYANSVRLVTVTLQWTNGTIPRVHTLSTYVGQFGIQNYIY